MRIKARIERLEKLQQARTNPKITIEVLDRVLDGTISDEEFARYMPFCEELFGDREAISEPHA
jgi:hypothetical protein